MFNNWIADLADLVNDWYNSLLAGIVEMLLNVSLPTPEQLSSDFFMLGLGATFGLSLKVITLITVIVGVIVLLTPRRRHGERIASLLTSILRLILFAILFFPVYAILYELVRSGTQGIINVATGSSDGTIAQLNDLLDGPAPVDIFSKLVFSVLASAFATVSFAIALTLRMALIMLLIFYPLLLALYPLGRFTKALFHWANGFIVVVLVSPPLMGFCFLLPLLAGNLIPGASNPLVSGFIMLGGAMIAAIIPILLFFFVKSKSQEVFGSLDSSISGSVDVASMPPVSLQGSQKDIQDTHASPLRFVAADVIGDGIMNGNLSDVKNTLVNTAASAAALAGHPYISVGLKAGNALVNKGLEKGNTQAEGGEESATDPGRE
jgi:hypothetical protein